jgi:uncharacterized protein (DUF433 family)
MLACFFRRTFLYMVMVRECISLKPADMGGQPCIRGTRVTVGTVVGPVASGPSSSISEGVPYLEEADVGEALAYAAWRSEEIEVQLGSVE